MHLFLGNLIVSIWLLLFVIASLFLIKNKNLKYRFSNINWLLIIFFSYFFILTLFQFNNYEIWINSAREAYSDRPAEENILPIWQKKNLTLENHPIFKSFILIRFVLLILVIDTLFFNKVLKIKKFFLVCFISTSFVSLDIIFQYILGFNLLGFKNFLHTSIFYFQVNLNFDY